MTTPEPAYAPAPGETPLSAPLYGASFGQAFKRFWQKYATFTGRASRSEYWWWYLASAIVGLVLYILYFALAVPGATTDPTTGMTSPGAGGIFPAILLILWGLATIVPQLALIVRRLHDANYAGPFIFLGLIPFVGGIILLVFTLLPSNPAGARFDARA